MSNQLTISLVVFLVLMFIAVNIKSNSFLNNCKRITPSILEKKGYILLKNEQQIARYKNVIENIEKENDLNFIKFEIYKSSPISNAYILAYFQDENNNYFMIEVI